MQVLYLLYVWSLLPGLKTFSGPCLVLIVAIKYRSYLLSKTPVLCTFNPFDCLLMQFLVFSNLSTCFGDDCCGFNGIMVKENPSLVSDDKSFTMAHISIY